MKPNDLDLFLLAVHDGDLEQPIPRAGALIRIARERGLVTTHAPLKADGSDRKRPVTITPTGIGYLREMGLVSVTESCA